MGILANLQEKKAYIAGMKIYVCTFNGDIIL